MVININRTGQFNIALFTPVAPGFSDFVKNKQNSTKPHDKDWFLSSPECTFTQSLFALLFFSPCHRHISSTSSAATDRPLVNYSRCEMDEWKWMIIIRVNKLSTCWPIKVQTTQKLSVFWFEWKDYNFSVYLQFFEETSQKPNGTLQTWNIKIMDSVLDLHSGARVCVCCFTTHYSYYAIRDIKI